MTESIAMPGEILKVWEDAIVRYSPGAANFTKALSLQRESLKLLWETYTQERKSLGRLRLTDSRLVAPYLLGFHVSNWARTIGTIQRALARGLKLPSGNGPIRLYDLGCGTGAATQAAWMSLRSLEPVAPFFVELVDRSRHLVECAEGMMKSLDAKAHVRTLGKSLDHPLVRKLLDGWIREKDSRLNVVLLSYVWNEVQRNPRAREALLRLLDRWNKATTPTWLIVVEPAAEMSARQAIELRDWLVSVGWKVNYPCPSSHLCPMGSEGRDWCYSEFDWSKPKLLQDVERQLGVSRAVLGAAAYLFTNRAAKTTDAGKQTVVGHPKVSGKTMTLVCNGTSVARKASHPQSLRGSSV